MLLWCRRKSDYHGQYQINGCKIKQIFPDEIKDETNEFDFVMNI